MKPDYDERCPLGKLHIIFFIPLILGAPSPYRFCYACDLVLGTSGIFQEPFPLGLLRSFQRFPKSFPLYRTYGEENLQLNGKNLKKFFRTFPNTVGPPLHLFSS